MKKYFFILSILLFLLNGVPALADSCDEAMRLTRTCGNNTSCLQRAGDLFNQCAAEKRQKADHGVSCRDKGNACAYRCADSTDYTSSSDVYGTMNRHQSCLNICAREQDLCRSNERKTRNSNNYSSGANGVYSPSVGSSIGNPSNQTRINNRNIGIQQGSVVSQRLSRSSMNLISLTPNGETKTNFPKADLDSRASVSGGNEAKTCVTLEKNSDGFIVLVNICAAKVKYSYCYDNWVPNPNLLGEHPNPFKCDAFGKPSFSGASAIGPNSTKKLPLQAGALKKKIRVGPCMDVVMIDSVPYQFLSSIRTGGEDGNSYECNYYRARVDQ